MSKIYSIWFHQIRLPENIKKQLLLTVGSYEAMYNGNEAFYSALGINKQGIIYIEESKKWMKRYEKEVRFCNETKVRIIDYLSIDYPASLKEIPDPPMVLFTKGNHELLRGDILAIVGSRKCNEYGFQVTSSLAKELACYDMTIVSGMAMGVDAAAHQGALQGVGKSIGVLGTGIHGCYPTCNEGLYKDMLMGGCLVTEYMSDALPRPQHFPKRNRIISGLAMGVIVTQANIRSGSLITANLALEYNREVFSVPGNVTSTLSLGTNDLIKRGAKCITEVEDIFEELPEKIRIRWEEKKKNTLKINNQLAQDERIVYAYVSQEPIILYELINRTQLSYSSLYRILIQLENKTLIKKLPGERYIRV